MVGIPCKHAIVAIQQNKEQLEKYLHACYNKETYLRTHYEIFRPMLGEELWQRTGKPSINLPSVLKPL